MWYVETVSLLIRLIFSVGSVQLGLLLISVGGSPFLWL